LGGGEKKENQGKDGRGGGTFTYSEGIRSGVGGVQKKVGWEYKPE